MKIKISYCILKYVSGEEEIVVDYGLSSIYPWFTLYKVVT